MLCYLGGSVYKRFGPAVNSSSSLQDIARLLISGKQTDGVSCTFGLNNLWREHQLTSSSLKIHFWWVTALIVL